MAATLDDRYHQVPATQRQRLADFRAAHPDRYLNVGPTRWHYLTGGAGETTLLILPGAARIAEPGFPLIAALAQSYRVIAPSYPPVATIGALIEGVVALLDAEGVTQVHVFGASYGGLIAQCFVRRHPQRVRRLILGTTSIPSRHWRWPATALVAIAPRIPMRLVRAVVRWGNSRVFQTTPEEAAFWHAYQYELLTCHLTKMGLLSLAQTSADFLHHWHFTPDDPHTWPGRVLLLHSTDDAIAHHAAQATLRQLYPQAQERTFRDAGHTPWLTQSDAYVGTITEFVRAR